MNCCSKCIEHHSKPPSEIESFYACECHQEKPTDKEKFHTFLKDFDFEGMSRAYRESEIAWSAVEWKNFIGEIRAADRAELVKKVEGMRIKKPWTIDEAIRSKDYNRALDDVLAILHSPEKE